MLHFLEKDRVMYHRSVSELRVIDKDREIWCTMTPITQTNYGPWNTKLQLNRDIKLMNVCTKSFREICKKMIDETISDVNERIELYLPFGLDGFGTTYKTISNMTANGEKLKTYPLTDDAKVSLKTTFDMCMRTSITSLDERFVAFLYHNFGDQYDGYVSLEAMPSMINNVWFPPEVCIFKPSCNVVEILSSTYKPIKAMVGGGVIMEPIRDVKYTSDNVNVDQEIDSLLNDINTQTVDDEEYVFDRPIEPIRSVQFMDVASYPQNDNDQAFIDDFFKDVPTRAKHTTMEGGKNMSIVLAAFMGLVTFAMSVMPRM